MNSVAVEYCAKTVAIVLVIQPYLNFTARKQWDCYELANECENFQYGSLTNFTVNPKALHQGLFLFKKGIKLLGHELIAMNTKGVFRIETFMGLPAISKGLDIIFLVDVDVHILLPEAELCHKIYETSNYLLLKCNMEKSKYASLGEVLGSMWLQRNREEAEVTGYKRRKRGSELGPKMMSVYGKQVWDYVSDEICYDGEDPTIYLATAIKLNSPENLASLDSISKRIFENSQSEIEVHTNIISDFRINECLMSFPKKNVTFTADEKLLVIQLFFNVIRVVLEENKTNEDKNINQEAASITKDLLSNHAGFSELRIQTIIRWHLVRDKILNTRGRKINIEIEACRIN